MNSNLTTTLKKRVKITEIKKSRSFCEPIDKILSVKLFLISFAMAFLCVLETSKKETTKKNTPTFIRCLGMSVWLYLEI